MSNIVGQESGQGSVALRLSAIRGKPLVRISSGKHTLHSVFYFNASAGVNVRRVSVEFVPLATGRRLCGHRGRTCPVVDPKMSSWGNQACVTRRDPLRRPGEASARSIACSSARPPCLAC